MLQPPPFSRSSPPQSVLVVRLGAVGDLVRTLPAVHLMRAAWPSARIAWVVEKHWASFLAGHPHIDELILLDRKGFVQQARRLNPRALLVVGELRRSLRNFRAELALDFQGSFKSGLVSRLSGARVRLSFQRAYVREGSQLFANVRVPLEAEDRHRVRRALALARAAGAGEGMPQADLALSAAEQARGKQLWQELAQGKELVALAPFSSKLQAWKRYPLERWREVATALAARGLSVALIAGPGEVEEALALSRDCGADVKVSSGTSLRELAALLAHCSLLIGGDTGPMHIAWGVGTAVVALYGPTDPVLNAPIFVDHICLAPPERSARNAQDKFPGVTPKLIVEAALKLLRERRLTP